MGAFGVPLKPPEPPWEPDVQAVIVVARVLREPFTYDTTEQWARRILLTLRAAGLY